MWVRELKKQIQLLVAVQLVLFLGFKFFYTSYDSEKTLDQIQRYSQTLAIELWRFDDFALKSYLKVVSEAERYPKVSVYDSSGNLFVSQESEIQRPYRDQILLKLGLLSYQEFNEDIIYQDQKIGHIVVTKINDRFYIYLYLGFILLLFSSIYLTYSYYSKKRKQLFIDMFDENLAPMILINPKSPFNIIDANKAAQEFYKKDLEVLKTGGMGLISLTPLDKFPTIFEKIISNQQRNFITKHRSGDDIRDVEVFASPMFSSSTVIIYALVIDVTEKMQAEEEKKGLQEQVFHQSKLASLGTLGAGIAHELNNPLAVIQGQASFAIRGIQKGTTKVEDQIKTFTSIVDQSKRMAKIVAQIKDFSRDSSKEEFEQHDLNEIITDTILLFNMEFLKSNVKLVVDLKTIPKIKILKIKIESVIQNLLVNSRDALSESTMAGDKIITIRTFLFEDTSAVLEIEDNGPGIPHDIQKRIFDPFFTTKPVGKGTGLGLSLVLGIVEKHGGNISLVSSPGLGAKFIIMLPISGEKLNGQ